MRVYNLILATSAIVVVLSWATPVAAETEKAGPEEESSESQQKDRAPAPAEEPGGEEEVVRFTNEDLPGLWPMDRRAEPEGDVEDGEEGNQQETGPGLDEVMEEFEEEAVQQQIVETRQTISQLEVRLVYLQNRLRSVQNPLLKRVTPSTAEEEEAVGGLSNVERLTWVKDQIAETEEALGEAGRELEELLRR
jgi:uncharacterized coiled-coil protein SlyX